MQILADSPVLCWAVIGILLTIALILGGSAAYVSAHSDTESHSENGCSLYLTIPNPCDPDSNN